MRTLRDIPVYGPSGQVERIMHAGLVIDEGRDWGIVRELKGFMFLDERPKERSSSVIR